MTDDKLILVRGAISPTHRICHLSFASFWLVIGSRPLAVMAWVEAGDDRKVIRDLAALCVLSRLLFGYLAIRGATLSANGADCGHEIG